MKILILTHSYGLNGAAILLRSAARHWVEEKAWEVDALMSPEEFSAYGEQLLEMGVNPKTDLTINKADYNVALINTILDIELASQISNNVPVVLWVHEGNTLLFNWGIPLATLAKNIRCCDRIIFQTKWQSDHVFKTFTGFLSPKKIHYIPSGVDIDGVVQKQNYSLGDPIRLISVGAVYGRKRQMDLVCAVRNLSKRYNIECFIVGDYSQSGDWLSVIHNDQLDANTCIRWLGAIHDRDEINRLLVQSDIACLPSNDESHPLALLEAGICGVPLLISALAPYEDIGWIDGKNCLMHEVGNILQIENQIERLIKEQKLRIRISNNAKNMVVNKYSKKKFFENMNNLFQSYSAVSSTKCNRDERELEG